MTIATIYLMNARAMERARADLPSLFCDPVADPFARYLFSQKLPSEVLRRHIYLVKQQNGHDLLCCVYFRDFCVFVYCLLRMQ